MYNKPITQRVALARSKKASALKQTSIEETTVLNKAIPPVTEAATVNLPGNTETIITPGELTGTIAEPGGKQMPDDKWLDFCDKNPCNAACHKQFGKCPDKEETITTPGGQGEAEVPLYQYDRGDSMPSWMQRKVERGLLQSARKTGKFASKLAKDQEKLAKLEEAGKTDSPKYAKLKARVGAREGALTAQKLFAETQMEAARQGKSPGSKNIVNIGTFDPNTRVTKVDNATERTTVGRQTTKADISDAEEILKAKQEAEKLAAIEAEKNEAELKKKSPLDMRSSFKMGGYGSKTYKK